VVSSPCPSLPPLLLARDPRQIVDLIVLAYVLIALLGELADRQLKRFKSNPVQPRPRVRHRPWRLRGILFTSFTSSSSSSGRLCRASLEYPAG